MKAMKILFLIGFFIFPQVHGATLKIGVLAPDGSSWAIQLKDMAKEIKKATNKRVKLKYYFGGSQGDEPAVLKKMRVGILHGGVFTGKTLGDIYSDVRILEVPFTFFSDHNKALKVMRDLTPHFDREFSKLGFKSLGFVGLGMVYFISKKQTPTLESLKGVKIWAWAGDKIAETMSKSLKLVSIPVPLPDVLGALQTGIVEAAYGPPMGIIALQWDSKTDYLLNFPITFAIGSFLLSDKGWKKVSPQDRKVVDKLARKYIARLNRSNIEDNAKSLDLMKSKGIKFINFPKSDLAKTKSIRSDILTKLKGKYFSPAIIKKLDSLL